MSNYDKRRIFRVYTYGKSYILSSQANENEKLQLKISNDSLLSLNKLSHEEWLSLTQQRNTTNSGGFVAQTCSLAFDSYGCLGLLTTSDTGQPINANDEHAASHMQHYLLFVKEVVSVGVVKKFEIMKITDIAICPLSFVDSYNQPQQQQYGGQANASSSSQPFSSYINDIKKFLSSGCFYFSYSAESSSSDEQFDLTLSAQKRNQSHQTNRKFLWNFNLHLPFRRFNVDVDVWLLKVICGCVEVKKVITTSQIYKACLFSRLSCDRVGTRFNCRGCNDEGNCANFVETEQVIYSVENDQETSFLQLRGSVPVFFEQSGIQVGSHKIKLSRSTYACFPAFERHLKSLVHEYGPHILVVNLLGIKGDESILTDFFYHMCSISKYSMQSHLIYSSFDYHQELKYNKQALGEKMWPGLVKRFYADNHEKNSTQGMFYSTQKEPKMMQTKFIRTNCMDCLDRTNNVQTFIGLEMLRYQTSDLFGHNNNNEMDLNRFRDVFRQMWIINGDCISKIYAGTGAIQGRSVTQDIARSLTRSIQNNFLDVTKNDAIETFLYGMSRNYGELADRVKVLMSQTFLRLPYSILKELVDCKKEYTEKNKCRVAIATWNVNGGLNKFDMDELKIADWLIDGPVNAKRTGLGYLEQSMYNETNPGNESPIDIFAIGFEEIVDLTAQNIVKSSDDNAMLWYKKIIECLNRSGQGHDYVQLNAENLQLVGVCLFVFVLRKHVGSIKDICISKTKTGFGGTAGNKGGVLLRFIYYNTSMCFVCSHFAAHQKEIRQRNEDFRQIYESSEFQGQAVTSLSKIETKFHDYVFWCGDLNYRIDLSNDVCRSLIGQRNWDPLLKEDQLCTQRNANNVFREFNEAPILFPPTYKYNLNEDTYDRSEKCRVPAWTDRILWRSKKKKHHQNMNDRNEFVKCLYYGRSDIRSSDHRPVSALFECEVSKVIPNKLIECLNRIFVKSHGSFQVVLIVQTNTNEMNELVKRDIYELFNKYKTFSSVRYFNNQLFFTYTDAKYGYEAFAELNNVFLQAHDLTLNVRIENEQSYERLIQHELKDCLSSLSYLNDNIQKLNLEKKAQTNIEVGNLLGNSFNEDSDIMEENENEQNNLLSLPSNLRPNSSITNDMIHLNSYDVNYQDRHSHHNPQQIVKALSNSNLQMFAMPPQHTHIHQRNSAVNLLDIENEEPLISTMAAPLLLPPKRPPPPTFVLSTNDNKNKFTNEDINAAWGDDSGGFDDDFASLVLPSAASAASSSGETRVAPTLPPLPLLPSLPPFSGPTGQTSTSKISFSMFANENLFDDSFEPTPTPPPIPSLPPQTISTSTAVPTRPPPLPPLPASLSSSTLIPSRPPPPPLIPSTTKAITKQTETISTSTTFQRVNAPLTGLNKKMSDLDLLGHPGDEPPPLPIRENHFY
jgi:phosphatidylinositol-bisphosphatase